MNITTRYLHSMEKDYPSPELRMMFLRTNLSEITSTLELIESDPGNTKLYNSFLKTALGDVMVQACLASLDFGFDPSDVFDHGKDHVHDRLHEKFFMERECDE